MHPLSFYYFFYSTIYHIHLQKGSKQENLQHREDRGESAEEQEGNECSAECFSAGGTCLCFLCSCLLIATLGVTGINQLCSVFGHQFDQAWKTKIQSPLKTRNSHIAVSLHKRMLGNNNNKKNHHIWWNHHNPSKPLHFNLFNSRSHLHNATLGISDSSLTRLANQDKLKWLKNEQQFHYYDRWK